MTATPGVNQTATHSPDAKLQRGDVLNSSKRRAIDPRRMLGVAGGWLRRNPGEVLRVARNALRWRFGVPLDVLRWLAAEFGGTKVWDVAVQARGPGLFIQTCVEQMQTPLKIACVVTVEEVHFDATQARVAVRLSELAVTLLDEQCQTAVAALLRSGLLDLTRPANLLRHMPGRPEVLVDAAEDRLVLDLMKAPKLARNLGLRRGLSWAATMLRIVSVEAVEDHLDVVIEPLPRGIGPLLGRVRGS